MGFVWNWLRSESKCLMLGILVLCSTLWSGGFNPWIDLTLSSTDYAILRGGCVFELMSLQGIDKSYLKPIWVAQSPSPLLASSRRISSSCHVSISWRPRSSSVFGLYSQIILGIACFRLWIVNTVFGNWGDQAISSQQAFCLSCASLIKCWFVWK